MQQFEWKGAKPCRFSGGRVHIQPQGELNRNLQPSLSTIRACGIRTFTHSSTEEAIHKPHLKIFPDSYQKYQKEVDFKGKKCVQEWPQKERHRSERVHLQGNFETLDEVRLRGIKPIPKPNKTKGLEYQVERKMQGKIRVPGLEEQRNQISSASLGDKAYKYPEYSTDFYKGGGLIPGSTIKKRITKDPLEHQVGSVLTKPNWNVKVRLEEMEEERKVVNDVDEWEQTILKEANPNWNDPDTFFERMEAQQSKKDQKKGAKK